ncbi:mannosyltransferase family protein [Actinomadura sp. DC4]|uniref:mannosyltransferase family protein n=1 Tax=Actinomadura sp. DC4 TaxID=3055069 RepID=UPI0025B1CD29|nr:mannosyltransferase family protein [Actinomadura sp. DC4]MDN3352859.1 mannosyltransferase family protein [Actinomadura sp. DC4]
MATPARLLEGVDRPALGAWFGTRLGVLVTSVTIAAFWSYGDFKDSFLERWTQWDVDLFIEIAKYGYRGDPAQPQDAGLPAFFPGLPMLIRTIHIVIPSWELSALLISLVAGTVAMAALARLGGAGTGPKAVLALLLSPYAVFLFAGYSETLFLAFALPAWLLARQRRWEPAVLCAMGAACVRVTGIFLAVALIVEFLVADRRWRVAPCLLAPFAPVFAYTVYQWRRTGDWLAWQHAQQEGWGRSLAWPWEAFHTTWDAAFGVHNEFTGAFRVELVAAVVGVALTLWLLVRRRWAEAVYVGLPLASLLTSAFYLSIGRATLLWWPVWLAIGSFRRPAYIVTVLLFVPLLVSEIALFTSGKWAG